MSRAVATPIPTMTLSARHELGVRYARPAAPLRIRSTALDTDSAASVRFAMKAVAGGASVVLIDPHRPDHPGYLLAAAQLITSQQVAFLVRHTSGVLTVPLAGADCDRLDLPLMVRHNENPAGTAFTVSVDAAAGVTTGISAADRAVTIRLLADPAATPDDFSRPGHVFPLRARPGGVLERARNTEAAVDLTRLAGVGSASVIAAIVNDDAADLTTSGARQFAAHHELAVITIPELVRYRQLRRERDNVSA